MKYKTQRQFIQENFPHINIEDAVVMARSKRLWPLCDLKNAGSCQGIAIIPHEVHQEGNLYYWETAPRIKVCADCSFHKKNCERC